jgi:hypothetical protein
MRRFLTSGGVGAGGVRKPVLSHPRDFLPRGGLIEKHLSGLPALRCHQASTPAGWAGAHSCQISRRSRCWACH